jgi:hypothetical protein
VRSTSKSKTVGKRKNSNEPLGDTSVALRQHESMRGMSNEEKRNMRTPFFSVRRNKNEMVTVDDVGPIPFVISRARCPTPQALSLCQGGQFRRPASVAHRSCSLDTSGSVHLFKSLFRTCPKQAPTSLDTHQLRGASFPAPCFPSECLHGPLGPHASAVNRCTCQQRAGKNVV